MDVILYANVQTQKNQAFIVTEKSQFEVRIFLKSWREFDLIPAINARLISASKFTSRFRDLCSVVTCTEKKIDDILVFATQA